MPKTEPEEVNAEALRTWAGLLRGYADDLDKAAKNMDDSNIKSMILAPGTFRDTTLGRVRSFLTSLDRELTAAKLDPKKTREKVSLFRNNKNKS